MTGYPLIAAMLDAPLMVVMRRWPRLIHAAGMGQIVDGWDRGSYESACGVKRLRFVGALDVDGTTVGAPFPPRIKGLPNGVERCRECWVATGKQRPRSEFKLIEAA